MSVEKRRPSPQPHSWHRFWHQQWFFVVVVMAIFGATILGLLYVLGAPNAPSAVRQTITKGSYPVLRSSPSNMRMGPGLDYPIRWKFLVRGMPVHVLRLHNDWVEVQDFDGKIGWMHTPLLRVKPGAVVAVPEAHLRDKPEIDLNQTHVAILERGLVLQVFSCDDIFCHVETINAEHKLQGWIERRLLWGIDASVPKTKR